MEGKRLNGGDTDQPICMGLYRGTIYNTFHCVFLCTPVYYAIIQRRLLKNTKKGISSLLWRLNFRALNVFSTIIWPDANLVIWSKIKRNGHFFGRVSFLRVFGYIWNLSWCFPHNKRHTHLSCLLSCSFWNMSGTHMLLLTYILFEFYFTRPEESQTFLSRTLVVFSYFTELYTTCITECCCCCCCGALFKGGEMCTRTLTRGWSL